MNLALAIALLSLLVAIAIVVWAIIVRRAADKRALSPSYGLDRAGHNPLISPHAVTGWENEGTFNPAAVEDGAGGIHIFYRAIGGDGISRIGHASSADGRNFSGRSPYPVFNPRPGCGMPGEGANVSGPRTYDIVAHPSGGGWGGAEDPRTTRIGDRVYMTYTAFEGWDNMRIAMTSISVSDLERGIWRWRRPALISMKGEKAKNWVLFPEKVNGRYAILHSIAPKVLVAYTDSLDAMPKIKSSADHGGYGVADKSRDGRWDKVVKGAGAPPLKTPIGWLVLYHAIHDGKYKVGAMILDLDDPTKVLYRSPAPILSPDAHYENDGKAGVVYATGAVIKDGKLLVYYGGGDRHACVAETRLQPLLDWLVAHGKV